MNKIHKLFATIGVILFLFTIMPSANAVNESNKTNCLYQISTLQALIQGAYDGETAVKDLLMHGDIGLGTFDGLDGEMIIIDGKAYKAKADGKVEEAKKDEKIPFANTAFIGNTKEKAVSFNEGYEDLKRQLNNLYPMQNMPTVFYMQGEFINVTYRSVPKQKKPYPKLTEVVKHQTIFTKEKIKGTIVGFRFPSYMQDINANGYHLHFISADKKFGGHFLNAQGGYAKVKAKNLNSFNMVIPEHINAITLDKIKPQDVTSVEK